MPGQKPERFQEEKGSGGGLAVRRCRRPVRFPYAYAKCLPPTLPCPTTRRSLNLLHPSLYGVRGPEQRNLYSKRRYEPGFMSLATYNTLQHEIRRHVTGVLNFERVLLEEAHEIESCLNFIHYNAHAFIYRRNIS